LSREEDGEPSRYLLSLQRGLRKGAATAFGLVKVVFPLYVLVNFLKDSGLLAKMAIFFAPLMKFVGLPGEAALAILAGNIGNIYAGLAVIGPLGLSPKQVTVVGLMLGLSHSLIVEAAVIHRMGARPVPISLFRFFLSATAGLILNAVMPG
jgi:hypothetical protein